MTKYEVRPEFKGDEVLLVWQGPDGIRDADFYSTQELELLFKTETEKAIEEEPIQRIYHGVDKQALIEAEKRIFDRSSITQTNFPWYLDDLSNQALDNLILRKIEE